MMTITEKKETPTVRIGRHNAERTFRQDETKLDTYVECSLRVHVQRNIFFRRHFLM